MKAAACAIAHCQNPQGMIQFHRHTKRLGRTAMREETKKLKADILAGEILQLAHASLLLHLRFMENALCRLEFTPVPKGSIRTDGRRFSYAPMHVLLRYRQERTNPARDYLHCVLHCVFRHMYLHAPALTMPLPPPSRRREA